jgi:hypothetical protein
MNRFEFEQLSQSEQIQVVYRYGTFLAEKIASGNRFYLYAYNSFYVELLHEFVNIRSGGLFVERIFDDSRYLKDYIENMIASSLPLNQPECKHLFNPPFSYLLCIIAIFMFIARSLFGAGKSIFY